MSKASRIETVVYLPVRRDGDGGPGMLSNDVRVMYGLKSTQKMPVIKHRVAVCVTVSIVVIKVGREYPRGEPAVGVCEVRCLYARPALDVEHTQNGAHRSWAGSDSMASREASRMTWYCNTRKWAS